MKDRTEWILGHCAFIVLIICLILWGVCRVARLGATEIEPPTGRQWGDITGNITIESSTNAAYDFRDAYPQPEPEGYPATISRVIDGDTVVAHIDLGLDVWLTRQHIRLHGIDAPELRGGDRPAGILAKTYLEGWLAVSNVVIDTHGDTRDKYGRIVGTLYVNGTNVNERMVAAGHAEVYDE